MKVVQLGDCKPGDRVRVVGIDALEATVERVGIGSVLVVVHRGSAEADFEAADGTQVRFQHRREKRTHWAPRMDVVVVAKPTAKAAPQPQRGRNSTVAIDREHLTAIRRDAGGARRRAHKLLGGGVTGDKRTQAEDEIRSLLNSALQAAGGPPADAPAAESGGGGDTAAPEESKPAAAPAKAKGNSKAGAKKAGKKMPGKPDAKPKSKSKMPGK